MKYRHISRKAHETVVSSLTRTGKVTRDQVVAAYNKWEYFAGAEPCIHGPDRHLAIDCECPGCLQRLMYLFFDQAFTIAPSTTR